MSYFLGVHPGSSSIGYSIWVQVHIASIGSDCCRPVAVGSVPVHPGDAVDAVIDRVARALGQYGITSVGVEESSTTLTLALGRMFAGLGYPVNTYRPGSWRWSSSPKRHRAIVSHLLESSKFNTSKYTPEMWTAVGLAIAEMNNGTARRAHLGGR